MSRKVRVLKQRRQRKPRLGTMIAQVEKAGKTVTSITLPDGTTLSLGAKMPGIGNPDSDPWEQAMMQGPKQ